MSDIESIYSNYTNKLKGQNRYRVLPDPQIYSSSIFLDFSGNDYLNLSKDPAILDQGFEAAREFGAGSTGSRLLSGNYPLIVELEKQIASDKQTETAITFASGYQANSSILATLCNQEVLKSKALLFFDKHNHSSLYQGAFQSQAELIRFQHNNLEQLENLLQKYETDLRPKFIVAETVYSMDGDQLDVNQIASIAKKHNAFLFLDEAHAAGIFGPQGLGLSSQANLSEINYAILGTFSKGFGGFGAYLACSNTLKEYLINKCPGFIYSTAPSPFTIGVALASWRKSKILDQERQDLLDKSNYLRKKLNELGFDTGLSTSPIIPIILGAEDQTLHLRQELFKNNILVSAIRPPTVPPGTSRLRLSLHSKLSYADLDYLIQILNALK